MKDGLETSEMRAGLPILAFADARAFDAWLESQSPMAPGFWLKLAKKGAPERTLAEVVCVKFCKDGHLGLV